MALLMVSSYLIEPTATPVFVAAVAAAPSPALAAAMAAFERLLSSVTVSLELGRPA